MERVLEYVKEFDEMSDALAGNQADVADVK
jgi:hypothetical protein